MAKPEKFRNKWRIRWTDEHGSRRCELYESHDDAKFALQRHLTRVQEVKRGFRGLCIPNKTFGDLCDYWLDWRVIEKRSARSDRSIIEKHLRPAFGPLQLTELTLPHFDQYKADRLHLDPKTISNQLTLLATMLNLAIELRWITEYPRIRKPRIRLNNADFCYLRTQNEIRRFLNAAADEGQDVLALYSTAIYTGMRAGELAGLRWGDVEFERRQITVQRSFDGPTKAGDVRYVPILDPLLPLLQHWRLHRIGELVFPNSVGKMHQSAARIFQETLHRVLKRAGFSPVDRKGKRKHYIVFHSLRHTFASHWVMNGGDVFKLREILGHKDIKMTMRYAHLAPHVYSADYSRFGSWVPGVPAPVTPLPMTQSSAFLQSNRALAAGDFPAGTAVEAFSQGQQALRRPE